MRSTTVATIRLALAVFIGGFGTSASAQTGGFVTTLGVDTVQVEEFTRTGNTLSGIVVQRSPVLRQLRWTLAVDDAGKPQRYHVDATDANGTPVLDGTSGTITYAGDSVTRTGYAAAAKQSLTLAIAGQAYHGPGLPYLGVSYLMYELAFADARRRAAGGDTTVYLLQMHASLSRPQRMRAFIISPDSIELDYYRVARSGWRFDGSGRLMRADWRNTTYRYQVERVGRLDAQRFATAWAQAENAGRGFGPLSPRDSVIGTIEGSRFTIDYSRPSKRGRMVWGDVVTMDKVWRLGADVATHFTTAADLEIGGTPVPAGRYTLWLIASQTNPRLVVSKAVDIFGTSYNATKDLARISMRRSSSRVTERLTLDIRDGEFIVLWDDVKWSVPVKVSRRPTGVEQLRWLAGCWQRTNSAGTAVTEEQWMSPRGNAMLGMSRTIRGDSLATFEYLRIVAGGSRLTYHAEPAGQSPTDFPSAAVTDSLASFENPAHDFPQRIIYRRRGADSLVARIEGTQRGAARGVDFIYLRVRCP